MPDMLIIVILIILAIFMLGLMTSNTPLSDSEQQDMKILKWTSVIFGSLLLWLIMAYHDSSYSIIHRKVEVVTDDKGIKHQIFYYKGYSVYVQQNMNCIVDMNTQEIEIKQHDDFSLGVLTLLDYSSYKVVSIPESETKVDL
jgi:hypothetical protein